MGWGNSGSSTVGATDTFHVTKTLGNSGDLVEILTLNGIEVYGCQRSAVLLNSII